MASRNETTWNAKRYTLLYTGAFAAVALLAFCTLIALGKTLIWEGDGMKQHLRALIFMGEWIRSGFESLLAGEGFRLPTFSFAMGYGQDIVSNMSYYAIGDPLNLITILVPAKFTYILFNALAVLRMYLAGLSFSLYCWKMKLGKPPAILAGALVYAFCMFSLCAVARHPFFLNAMVYFPLVLLGVERVISLRKPGLFIAAIAVSAMSNFYFFYMIFVLMAMYIVWRLACLNGRNLKASVRDFGWLVGTGSIGVLISCAIFLPSALALLSDARAATGAPLSLPDLLYYGADHVKAFVFGLSATSDPGEWSLCGYGIIAIMAVFLLFGRKGRLSLKIAFAVLTAMLLLPAAGLAMNGFSYASNRWVWGYSMLVCCILTVCWEDLLSIAKRQAACLGLCCAAYLGISAWCGSGIYGTWQSVLICIFQAVVAAAAILVSRLSAKNPLKMRTKANAALVALVATGIAANSVCLFAPFAANYAGKLLDWDYASRILDSESQELADQAQTDDPFWRYSGIYWSLNPNSGLTSNTPSTDYYWSLSNSSVSQFMEETGANTQEYEANRYRNLDERGMLEDLARVRYRIGVPGEAQPFGYSLSASEAAENSRTWKIYRNDEMLPFAYACPTLIDRDRYLEMDMAGRQQALLQTVLVDSPLPGIREAQVTDTAQRIPFAVETEGVTQNPDGTFTASGPGRIRISFQGLPDCETYLAITDLECKETRSRVHLTVTFDYEDGSKAKRKLKHATQDYERSSGRKDYLVNSGYSQSAATGAVVSFSAEGTYRMALQPICQGFEGYEEQIAALGSCAQQNLNLHYPASGLAASNLVEFDMTAEQESVVTTAIPYSKAWTVLVDGKPVETIRTNTMFAGFAMDAGSHHIQMRYRTPGLAVGIAASVAGLALLTLLMHRLRKKRRN